MSNKKPTVFFSYTIRDSLITKDLLIMLKKILSLLNLFNTYIDLIDNNSNNPQLNVINELKNSTLVCVIETPAIDQSPWVNKELHIAKKHCKPILKISFDQVDEILKTKDINLLYTNKFILSIINLIIKNN